MLTNSGKCEHVGLMDCLSKKLTISKGGDGDCVGTGRKVLWYIFMISRTDCSSEFKTIYLK